MARIVGGGPPVNDAERRVLACLRDDGPDDWLVLHNIEVRGRNGSYEVDAVVVTGYAVWLIDTKGTHGRIEVAGSRWYPERGQAFGSPVLKLNSHARAVKGDLQRARPELSQVYVGALVVLTAPDATLVDPGGRDSPHVTTIDDLVDVLSEPGNGPGEVPARFADNAAAHQAAIIEALGGVAHHPSGPMRLGSWEVVERLGGDGEVTEYRAVNANLRDPAERVLLRVYRADPLLPSDQRQAQQRRIANAYDALCRMPAHPCIVGRRDFFPIEDESRFVLVLDDAQGHALRLHLTDPRRALAADARLRVVADLLRGLAHAHGHRVVHRALSPDTVLVTGTGSALLSGFDYARPAGARSHTVLGELTAALDTRYLAPECQAHPERLSAASDVYAAGIIGYRLLTGELPFSSPTDQFDKGSVLPADGLADPRVPAGLAELLTQMCSLAPSARPTAAQAHARWRKAMAGSGTGHSKTTTRAEGGPDYRNLPENHPLTQKYLVRRKLGSGTYGVAYQVYDDLASADRVVKIVLRDRESVVERLRHEFQILMRLPPHPNVVQVVEANYLNATGVPYLAFEYVAGQEVGQLISGQILGPADALRLGADVARGLAYLHDHGIYHCDVKPSNLVWSDAGCKIIDFNVAVTADSSLTRVGGTARYSPPDISGGSQLTAADLADRDLYALGVTIYQVLTGAYPWDAATPPPGQPPMDPRTLTGLSDLSPALVDVVTRAIAPRRSDRYPSAAQLLAAIEDVAEVRRRPEPLPPPPALAPANVNPFVNHLQTLYSQSARSNAGTRGRDARGLYVATALDKHLTPDVLDGRYALVVITGNAGDGKTTFLEHLAEAAARRGAVPGPPRLNGSDFTFNGRRFRTCYDGSQDEGAASSDQVLGDFFGPFAGAGETSWPDGQTRVIAINEGRLVDFLAASGERFPWLAEVVRRGLHADQVSSRAAVINLNRRSVVAEADELNGSIFDRVVAEMAHERHWEYCGSCDLAAVCYAPHNARTFAHPSAGSTVTRRLRDLYALTELRGQLHVTIRDLRSALSYMLTSGRDCGQIHDLYSGASTEDILGGFYFNSWAGEAGTADRLLAVIRDMDIARVPAPRLDSRLDHAGPDAGTALMTIDQRGDYDTLLLRRLFSDLPRGSVPGEEEKQAHHRYLASARRRFYFECADDDRARRMLPYRSAASFLDVLEHPESVTAQLRWLVKAINRSEGLTDPRALGDVIALQSRDVPGGTVRSYRLFPVGGLSLEATGGTLSPYLEGRPAALTLRYHGHGGPHGSASLRVSLDLYEMLHRLADGYLPGAAERQGRYLDLAIFKNQLSAVPYQEVLLTAPGLRRIRREPDGRLVMEQIQAGSGPEHHAPGEQ